MLYNSLTFWTLLVGLLTFTAKFFFPTLPFDETQILAALMFLLGLVGVYPQMKYGAMASGGALLSSYPFWVLVAGLVSFLVHFFFPTFPVDNAVILAVILFVLSQLGIKPTLMKLGLAGPKPKK